MRFRGPIMARVNKNCLTLTNWTFGSLTIDINNVHFKPKITPLLSRFQQFEIRSSLDKLVLRNRSVGQKTIRDPSWWWLCWCFGNGLFIYRILFCGDWWSANLSHSLRNKLGRWSVWRVLIYSPPKMIFEHIQERKYQSSNLRGSKPNLRGSWSKRPS